MYQLIKSLDICLKSPKTHDIQKKSYLLRCSLYSTIILLLFIWSKSQLLHHNYCVSASPFKCIFQVHSVCYEQGQAICLQLQMLSFLLFETDKLWKCFSQELDVFCLQVFARFWLHSNAQILSFSSIFRPCWETRTIRRPGDPEMHKKQ